jgi:GrpB-like predicted nucleotidyltransferase (UPF0157 family)
VLVTVKDPDDEPVFVAPLERAGYVLGVREPEHRMLRTPALDVQVHVWAGGDREVERCLRFRDRLRSSKRLRDRYEPAQARARYPRVGRHERVRNG